MEQFADGAPGYQDGNHKPELIVAVSEFKALCGFRPILEVAQDIASLANDNEIFLGWLQALDDNGLKGATQWAFDANQTAVNQLASSKHVLGQDRAQLIAELDSEFPNDNGLLVSVLMNQVTLQPGQALFLPAGNIHSYLSGLGLEVMAASDNVLRGGLTKKPVDLEELMQVLIFEPLLDPLLQTKMLSQGLDEYPVPVEDFSFYRVTPSSDRMLVDLALKGTAILVCVAGEITLSNSLDELIQLAPGEAAFMRAANFFSITGSGTGYLAMG
jgi:mannose-6-phosphate isomerase